MFLNVLSSFIPNDERIITIEDSAELQMQQEHVVRLETRPPNLEGFGEITQRDLVRNALRMRPERIILGEVRSGEALDMLQAMNTGARRLPGHYPRQLPPGWAWPAWKPWCPWPGSVFLTALIRHQIASAIHVIIQLARLSDGSRKMMNLYEIVGIEGDMITMQEIFCYELLGIGEIAGSKGGSSPGDSPQVHETPGRFGHPASGPGLPGDRRDLRPHHGELRTLWRSPP